MRRATTVAAAVVVVLVLGTGAGWAAGAWKAAPKASVKTTLIEFKVKPKPKAVKAGKVTFVAKNLGGIDHELIVVRLASPGAALPLNADGSVNDAAIAATDAIGILKKFKPHKTKKLVVPNLAPGTYELYCNIVTKQSGGTVLSHYAKGMHAELTVR